jgi:hypothetical protein
VYATPAEPSLRSEAGTQGGVSISLKSHLYAQAIPKSQLEFRIITGRPLRFAALGITIDSLSVLVISAYFWNDQPDSELNTVLLHQLQLLMQAFNMPVPLMADFNMTVEQCMGLPLVNLFMLDCLKLDLPATVKSKNGRNIDYVLVKFRFMEADSIRVGESLAHASLSAELYILKLAGEVNVKPYSGRGQYPRFQERPLQSRTPLSSGYSRPHVEFWSETHAHAVFYHKVWGTSKADSSVASLQALLDFDEWRNPAGETVVLDPTTTCSIGFDALCDSRNESSVALASAHFLGKGLEKGADWEPTLLVLRTLRAAKDKSHDRIAAIETILSAACWSQARVASISSESAQCPRSGHPNCDDLHTYWQSPANSNVQDKEVADTQYLCHRAEQQAPLTPCLWLRGILPRDPSLKPLDSKVPQARSYTFMPQSVPRSELSALSTLTEHLAVGATAVFFTDNEGVWSGVQEGPAIADRSCNHDLWRKVFGNLVSKSLTLNVWWIPSHLNEPVHGKTIPPYIKPQHIAGNTVADMQTSYRVLEVR